MATTLTLPEAARRYGGLTTIASRAVPDPDFADISVVPLPSGASLDPAVWAEEIFHGGHLPAWIKGLMAVRQAVVGLIGISRGDPSVFDIDEREGNAVLIADDERHLDMRVGVGVDPDRELVWCATVVTLHGWRGKVYFAPVRALHPAVVRSMMDGAARRLTPAP